MIVVFGSINVDLVVPVQKLPVEGETVLGPSYSVVPGGKGANQALAARRAGASVAMVGAIGQDGFAADALVSLAEAGVDLSHVRKGTLPTGAAFIAVDAAGGNLIIVASGANHEARQEDVLDAWLSKDAVVVLQMEVPLAENWALLKRARQAGARTLLNCAPAGEVPDEVLRALSWLVVNESEALAVARSQDLGARDPIAAAHALAKARALTVVVTLGGQGACAFLPDGKGWSIAALPIEPVDTTAAGDAFVGAFAAAMQRGADLPEALRHGSVAGALACTVAGAQPSLPLRAAIEASLGNLEPAVPI